MFNNIATEHNPGFAEWFYIWVVNELHWAKEDTVAWAWIFGCVFVLFSVWFVLSCISSRVCILYSPCKFSFLQFCLESKWAHVQYNISLYRSVHVIYSGFDRSKPKSFLTSRHAGQCRFLINSCNRTWASLSEPFPLGCPKKNHVGFRAVSDFKRGEMGKKRGSASRDT